MGQSFATRLRSGLVLTSAAVLLLSTLIAFFVQKSQFEDRARLDAAFIARVVGADLRAAMTESQTLSRFISRDPLLRAQLSEMENSAADFGFRSTKTDPRAKLASILSGTDLTFITESQFFALFDSQGTMIYSKSGSNQPGALSPEILANLHDQNQMSWLSPGSSFGSLLPLILPDNADRSHLYALAAEILRVGDRPVGYLITGRDLTPRLNALLENVPGRLSLRDEPDAGNEGWRFQIDEKLEYRVPSGLFNWAFAQQAFVVASMTVLPLLGLIIFVSFSLTRTLMAPLQAIKDGINAFTESRFGHRIPMGPFKEFNDIGTAFNTMMQGFRLSRLDGLTGLFNRRHFDQMLVRMVEMQKNYAKPRLCLSFIDIDHFKRINDTLGHPVGDQAIRHLSAILTESLPVTDIIARYGGEEFVIIHTDASIEEASEICSELVERVRMSPFDSGMGLVSFTISVGLADIRVAGLDGLNLVEMADKALYAAKQTGRNKLVIAPV